MAKMVITIEEYKGDVPEWYGTVRVESVKYDPHVEAKHLRLVIPKELWGQEALAYAIEKVIHDLG